MSAKSRKKPEPFLLIAGPCVIETERLCMQVAEACAEAARAHSFRYVFKASYDKANRTSGKAFRGPGLQRGLQLLAKVAKAFGVPALTDVHSPEEAKEAAQYVEILQIPAFLCRQTDLLEAAAATGRVVNVKKGQFMAPWDTPNIAAKLKSAGCKEYYMTERGTTFGYGNLVVDMRSLAWMREQGLRVIFDATHSVQKPGGLGHATGGDRAMAPVLARAATAAGIDGLFVEAHPDPDKAKSDGPNQLHLRDIAPLLRDVAAIRHALQQPSLST